MLLHVSLVLVELDRGVFDRGLLDRVDQMEQVAKECGATSP
jgi:hypothetical protein